MSPTNSKNARGFSLIEVLVAVVILSVGLLALASLQLAMIRSSGDTKAQTIAAALAKDKMEELRSFQTLAAYAALTTPAAGTVENLTNAAAAGNQGGIDFTRTTTIRRYVYNKLSATAPKPGFELLSVANNTANDATLSVKDATHDYVLGKDFKQIKVVVGWTNSSGLASSVSLEDVVDSLDPSEAALVAKNSAGGLGPRRIQVKITDPALDAMVIPIALGGGVNSAATNPKPNVVRSGNTVETQFDVLTYAGLQNGTATVQAKVETLVVGCTCDITEAPATTARGKRPTYWDGSRYTVPLDVADYSPPAATDTESASQQSVHCSICCRDHHDPIGTVGATFSPLRVTKVNGVVTVKHPHFVDKLATVEATATYKEACRLIRSDGIWSVAADLANDYFGLLATGNGTTADTFIPDSTTNIGTPPVSGGAVARYQKFALDYMGSRFITPTPTTGNEQATYNTVGNPVALAATAPYVLDSPASIDMNATDLRGKWLHSRGLYVDYLETAAVDAITVAKADTVCNTATVSPAQTAAQVLTQCILRLLPFTSINLSEIADWSPQSVPFNVTNNNYSQTLAPGDPVRGLVTTSGTTSMTTSAISKSRKSNTGLLDLSFDAISEEDNKVLSDSQPFSLLGAVNPPPPTPGNGTFLVNLSMPVGFVVGPPLGTSYVTGVQLSRSCGNTLNNTCDVQNATTIPAAGLGIANSMSIIIGGYNKHSDLGTSTTVMPSCVGAGNAVGILPNKSSSGSHNQRVCLNYSVTSATITNGSIASIQSPPANNGLETESTQISFPLINATPTDTIAVIFGGPVSTNASLASCSFTCDSGVRNGDCQAGKATFTGIFNACP